MEYPAITQNQRDNFKPTALYIKQHSITKLKYFGKTITTNIEKYKGSGTYWGKHINKHGKQFVETTWYQVFTDIDDLVEFAIFFSEFNNIIESIDWANLKIENGLDGGTGYKHTSAAIKLIKESSAGENNGMYGKHHTEENKKLMGTHIGETHHNYGIKQSPETIEKRSIAMTGKKQSPEHIENNRIARIGKKLSLETRKKQSISRTGTKRPLETRKKMSESKLGKKQRTLKCPHCEFEGGGNMQYYHFDKCKYHPDRIDDLLIATKLQYAITKTAKLKAILDKIDSIMLVSHSYIIDELKTYNLHQSFQ